jgi:hypothetical protein
MRNSAVYPIALESYWSSKKACEFVIDGWEAATSVLPRFAVVRRLPPESKAVDLVFLPTACERRSPKIFERTL